jgi:hypothetical protein
MCEIVLQLTFSRWKTKRFEKKDKKNDECLLLLSLLFLSKASGRYLTSNGHHWLMDLANFARKKFPDYPIPSRTLPVWLFKIVGRFDSRMDKSLLHDNTVEGFFGLCNFFCF